jgi:hypothetical protein
MRTFGFALLLFVATSLLYGSERTVEFNRDVPPIPGRQMLLMPWG